MKIAELIPQVFYDTIARFASGSVLILTVGAIWFDESTLLRGYVHKLFGSAPLAITIVLIVSAYVLAVCVEGMGIVATRGLSRFRGRKKGAPRSGLHNTVWKEAWGDFLKVHSIQGRSEPERPSEAIAIDVLRSLSPAVGSRIVKLRAEVAMCRNLWIGWASILVLHFAQNFIGRLWLQGSDAALANWLGVDLALVAGTATVAVRGKAIDSRHVRALYNHWLLLVEPGSAHLKVKGANSPQGELSPQPHALVVRLRAIREDEALGAGGSGSRKLVVTEVYDSVEEIAATSEWQPPSSSEKSAVLRLTNAELATFSEQAGQARHYHKSATEIYSVLEGEMEIEVEGDTFVLSRGDTIVVGPGAAHEVRPGKHKFIASVLAANAVGPRDKYSARA